MGLQACVALERVGLYVPGGKATLSLRRVIMNAVPASVRGGAGDRDGDAAPARTARILPEVLMAARVAGVHQGLQAWAAPRRWPRMAYGTESVPRVDKIVGPGKRLRGDLAKRFVFGEVDDRR